MHSTFILYIWLFLLVISPTGDAFGGSVRLSLLREPGSVGDTINLLRKAGCTTEALEAFRRVAKSYHETEHVLDLSKFPNPRDDFYTFKSPHQLVAALPHSLWQTPHAYDINCFDVVILLAGNQIRSGVRPDEIAGPFLFGKPGTNDDVNIAFVATARDMFTNKYAPWYYEVTESAIPKSMADARICLTAGLFANYVLPMPVEEKNLGPTLLKTLQASWRRQGLEFSKNFEVILCHQVVFNWRLFHTTHAGLLLRRGTGYTLLEKAGGRGPFVRLDVETRDDLLPWLTASFQGVQDTYSHAFVTFDANEVKQLSSSPPGSSAR